MRTLIRSLRRHIPEVILMVGLFVLQAFCELRIPEYTADVIDIGIGQSGIASPLVEELSAEGMEHLLLLMTQEEQEIVLNGYVQDGDVFRKQKLNAEEECTLEETLAAPMVAVYALSTDGADYEEVLGDLYVPRGMDVFGILSALPAQARLGLTEAAREQIRQVPQSLISQAAVNFVREDLCAQGVDVEELQKRYLAGKGAAMVLAALGAAVFAVLAAILGSRVGVGCAGQLRQEMFERVISFREAAAGRCSVSELIARGTGDIGRIERLLTVFFRMALYAPLLGAGAMWKMIALNRRLGWIAAAVLGLALLLIVLGTFLAFPRYRRLAQQADELARTVRETVKGMTVMRIFGMQEREKERLRAQSRSLSRVEAGAGCATVMVLPSLLLLMNAAVLLAAWRGAHGINEGSMLSGDLVAGIQYMMMEVGAFVTLASFAASLPAGLSAAARVEEVLNPGRDRSYGDDMRARAGHNNQTMQGSKERRQSGGDDTRERAEQNGEAQTSPALEFRGVSFAYPGQEIPVLENVSFSVGYGERVALVGTMGSGKTTLIQMVVDICRPTEGEVLIDGRPSAEYEPRERCGKLGYVPQDALLFSGTVESNLRFGRPEASREELRSALRTAQAEEFVFQSDRGLALELAQGGRNLSGGQRQRLAIARALVGDPSIFLLDDCFSALDRDTDAKLRRELGERTKGAAVLVASQQVASILDADRIVVLDGGRVAGIGRHEELMRSCEEYRQIALSQEIESRTDRKCEEDGKTEAFLQEAQPGAVETMVENQSQLRPRDKMVENQSQLEPWDKMVENQSQLEPRDKMEGRRNA